MRFDGSASLRQKACDRVIPDAGHDGAEMNVVDKGHPADFREISVKQCFDGTEGARLFYPMQGRAG